MIKKKGCERPIRVLASTVVLIATAVTPPPATADPSVSTVIAVGGVAALGIMLAHDSGYVLYEKGVSAGAPSYYVTPPYPKRVIHANQEAVIYSSVAPMAPMVQQRIPPQGGAQIRIYAPSE
ncbi:MAG: hypothetical protein H7839_10425 [Magnetococcus sp. YQC-5]